jgi:hypothetical protein
MIKTAAQAATIPASFSRRKVVVLEDFGSSGICFSGGDRFWVLVWGWLGGFSVAAVNEAEHDRDEEERCAGGNDETADDGTAERGVLLTAFAHA